MSEQQPDITGLRHSLDEVDSGIVGLIAQRSSLIAEIARLKRDGAAGMQDPEREQRVLDGVEAVATDLGVSATLVRRIFRELISDSVAQQARFLQRATRRPGPGGLPGRRARLQRRRRAQVPGRPRRWRAT